MVQWVTQHETFLGLAFVPIELDESGENRAMKKILFLHPGKANLPEISIYKRFFPQYMFVNCQDLQEYSLEDFDLLWRFMGMDLHGSSNIPIVHEYASLSVGHGARWKDWLKKHLNIRPSLRIFLNSAVHAKFGFRDGVPHCYRDMGVDAQFFCTEAIEKKYDFVYVGNMGAERKFSKVLDFFSRSGKSLLLIGTPPNTLYQIYKKFKNLIFAGAIPYRDVPSLARQAEYAVNYIPDQYPYNLQTSTKLLEYVAMGLKIVTTDYSWVRMFEKNRKMHFYKFSEDFHDMNLRQLENFPFCNTSIEDLRWENIMEASGIGRVLDDLLGDG